VSWRLVEGVPLPDAVGGHPALDFCNTRAGWGDPAPKEYLRTPRVLALWARENGLVPDAPYDADAEALGRAVALRDALYRCALRAGTEADWELVSAEASAARAVSVLRPDGDAGAVWAPRAGTGTTVDALRAVALAAEGLLTSELSAFVSACPGAGCGWLFADRRGRRRWCSMAACGNRDKAIRHGRTAGHQ
jgi:predicted RNA-binding Zn ribbon-like protein